MLDTGIGACSVLLSLVFIYVSKLTIDVATGATEGTSLWQAGA